MDRPFTRELAQTIAGGLSLAVKVQAPVKLAYPVSDVNPRPQSAGVYNMNATDLVKLVREGKLSVYDWHKLVNEGRNDEANALMKALKEVAENAPDEIVQEIGRPAICKRRGKLVVPDEDGGWKLKNPPRQKKKHGRLDRP